MRWSVLTSSNTATPRLLVRSRFSTAGYAVEITDLSRIWAEDLDREQIVSRAVEARTSIDPSEDDEQYNIFLDKVNSALKGDQDTSLHISDIDDDILELDLEAPLPAPLPAFKWTMQLRLQPRERLESEVVAPLILQASDMQHQIKDLVERLHEKDRVISKICDRLETSGNDLTTVFPGVSNVKTSRKKSQREQLARHVKGLLDFDEEGWRGQSRHAADGHDLSTESINSVFRDMVVNEAPTIIAASNGALMRRSELSEKSSGCISQHPGHKATHTKDESRNDAHRESQSFEEEEFQRQKTPPHLRPPSSDSSVNGTHKDIQVSPILPAADMTASQARDNGGDSSTEDEVDLDSQPGASTISRTEVTKSKVAEDQSALRGLGRIGGRSKMPEKPPPEANDAATDDAVTPPLPSEQTSKRKLGAIGGKRSAPNPPVVPVPGDDKSDAERDARAAKPKLGALGGRKAVARPSSSSRAATNPPQEVVESSPVPMTLPPKAQSPELPSETAEKVADRKRDQLKRELEDRAKAPVKKKRRF